MNNIIQLNKEIHKKFSLERSFNYSFSNKDCLCPITMAEIPHIVQQAPLVFVKNDLSVFGIFMLQSYTQQTNNFCDNNGKWLGSYIPARYRQYPFYLANSKNGEEKLLCFDQNSNLINKKTSKTSVPLFDDQGEVTEHIKNVINFLKTVEQNRIVTQKMIDAIENNSLFEQWNLKIKSNESELKVNGLWTISRTKLANLSEKALGGLHKLNALELIYSHFLSLSKVQSVANLANLKNKSGSKSLKERAIDRQKETADKEVDSLVKNLLDGD